MNRPTRRIEYTKAVKPKGLRSRTETYRSLGRARAPSPARWRVRGSAVSSTSRFKTSDGVAHRVSAEQRPPVSISGIRYECPGILALVRPASFSFAPAPCRRAGRRVAILPLGPDRVSRSFDGTPRAWYRQKPFAWNKKTLDRFSDRLPHGLRPAPEITVWARSAAQARRSRAHPYPLGDRHPIARPRVSSSAA